MDVIIVGQGLAGSVLAWYLIQKRLKVAVIDEDHRGSASMVAAGLVNPVTGKRLVKSWHVDTCLPAALQFYRHLEITFGRSLYHQKPILRLFNNPEEVELWDKRREQPDYERYIGPLCSSHVIGLHTPQTPSGFYIHHSGYLDTRELLQALKTYLQHRQCLVVAPLNYEDIKLSRNRVHWKHISAERLVFCEGYRIRDNPWFCALPLQPAKGEIITLKTHQPLPKEIINGGKWLLPLEPDKLKIGATFQWQPVDSVPSEVGKQQLLNACHQLGWQSRNDQVIQHLCGVRPGTRDKKPFIGWHPGFSRLGVFNGFGAKGSMLIPFFAALFADCLGGAGKLPDEVDIKRFGLLP